MASLADSATILTQITLYGCLADAGGRTVVLALAAAGVGDAELRQLIAAARPAIADLVLSPRTHLCVDDAIISGPMTIPATARIALFPPVSGG